MRWLIVLLLTPLLSAASPPSAPDLLSHSQQLLVVLTPNWEAVNGTVQLYQRATLKSAWVAVGKPSPVVVGRKGLAWGVELAKNKWPGPNKKEGDERSPVGVFKVGAVFGYDSQPSTPLKLTYFPLTETTVCVDDEKSQYYNQMLDRSHIQRPDWSSAEQMRQVPLYSWGAVVQYNSLHPVRGAGSCIFLHLWRGPDRGTAGCVAMDQTALVEKLAALEPAQRPLILILTVLAYSYLKKTWALPLLNNHN